MARLQILQNTYNRFEIEGIRDKELDDKKVNGIAGYHGPLANIIGWILEIFHKTVAIPGTIGAFYLNCKSVAKFLNRVDPKKYRDIKVISKKAQNSRWVEKALRNVKAEQEKVAISKSPLVAPYETFRSSTDQTIESVSINPQDDALFEAVKQQKSEECAILISKGVNINARNKLGVLLLEEAIKTQNGDLIVLLMLKNPDLSLKPSKASGCETLLDYIEKLEWQDPQMKQDLKSWFG